MAGMGLLRPLHKSIWFRTIFGTKANLARRKQRLTSQVIELIDLIIQLQQHLYLFSVYFICMPSSIGHKPLLSYYL